MKRIESLSSEPLGGLPTVLVQCGDAVVRVGSNIGGLFTFCRRYLPLIQTDCEPDAEVFFILPEPGTAFQEAGDFTVDFQKCKLIFGGWEHYGKLKSLISSMASTSRASERRQGVHACAFQMMAAENCSSVQHVRENQWFF